MSLRSQVALLLVILSIVFIALTYSVQTLVVMPAFATLEQQAAESNVARCVDAIKRDVESLSNITNDWGAWDDTYKYVEDHNADFAADNLVSQTFVSAKVNFICIVNTRRQIVWSEARDLETLNVVEVPALRAMLQEETNPFGNFQHVDDGRTGIQLTRHGPLLLAARPIITSKREGPIRGTVIMGRFLNAQEIKELADRTHVELDVWTVAQNDLPPDARDSLAVLQDQGGNLFQSVDAKTLHAYTLMDDVQGQPALVLRVTMARDVTLQGQISSQVAIGCSVVGGLLTLVAMWLVLQWRIVGPLQHMAAHAVRVGRRDDLQARLQLSRADEIGVLAGEFDRMVEHLAASRSKARESAHRAGMAEIASDVLHNVGNAVNSANCSIELLEQQLQASKVTGLERAAALLAEQAPHAAAFFARDPRGPKLVEYLVNLSESLRRERQGNQVEVDRLRETVRHIRDAIASQQEHAERSDFRQEVALAALVTHALQLNREGLEAAHVQVQLDLPPLPELQLNKSKTTQILVNLIRNAVQAMQDQPADARRLTLAARLDDDGGLEIEVRDSGMGFDADVHARLFTHGFTTKPEGHGFGLHYCANAVKEAGGAITARSPGRGRGATFVVRIPRAASAATTTS
jgi:two-component system, NtrC family, sensor kinase